MKAQNDNSFDEESHLLLKALQILTKCPPSGYTHHFDALGKQPDFLLVAEVSAK